MLKYELLSTSTRTNSECGRHTGPHFLDTLAADVAHKRQPLSKEDSHIKSQFFKDATTPLYREGKII